MKIGRRIVSDRTIELCDRAVDPHRSGWWLVPALVRAVLKGELRELEHYLKAEKKQSQERLLEQKMRLRSAMAKLERLERETSDPELARSLAKCREMMR